MHTACPVALKDPMRHGLQPTEPFGLNVPAAQVAQRAEPLPAVNVPGGQEEHAAEPLREYDPGAQKAHDVFVVLNEPGPH